MATQEPWDYAEYLQDALKDFCNAEGFAWARIRAGQGAHGPSLSALQVCTEARVHQCGLFYSLQKYVEVLNPSRIHLGAAATHASAV